jgi:hypothetical protein
VAQAQPGVKRIRLDEVLHWIAEARDPGPDAVRERLRAWLPEYVPPSDAVSRRSGSA